MKKKSKRTCPTKLLLCLRRPLSWAGILLIICNLTSCGNNQVSPPSNLAEANSEGFIEGVWVDQWLLNKVKERQLDSAWGSLRNFTHFGTYLNEKGKPSWMATVPDHSGTLSMKNGSWYDGQVKLLEFHLGSKDTTVQYHFSALGYEEEGVGAWRTFQLIPRQRKDDTYISDDWIYQLYYFPGSYLVDPIDDEAYQVGLGSDGEILGMEGYSHYSLNIGNSLPLFGLESLEGWKQYVIQGTKGGFLLFEVVNEKELDGYDNDIVQGPLAFKFIEKTLPR